MNFKILHHILTTIPCGRFLSFPFYRWENWGSQRLCNSLKAILESRSVSITIMPNARLHNTSTIYCSLHISKRNALPVETFREIWWILEKGKVQTVQILLTPLGKAYSPRTIALSRVRVVNGTLGVSLEKQNQRCQSGHGPSSSSRECRFWLNK